MVPISSDRHWVRPQGILLLAQACPTAAFLVPHYHPWPRMQPRVRPPRLHHIKSHLTPSHSRKPLTLTSQFVVSRNSQHHCFHRVGSGDPVSVQVGAGARVRTTLTWKVDFWMPAIRGGRALVQDAADYGVCDEYWCNCWISYSRTTSLLRSISSPPCLFLNICRHGWYIRSFFNMFLYDSSMINALYYVTSRDTIE